MIWLRKRKRLLEANEAMYLQGVPFADFEALRDSACCRPCHLHDLAGSAFNAYNVLAIMCGMLGSYSDGATLGSDATVVED
eukprot:9399320-Pyramimonas_sp.AAC.1